MLALLLLFPIMGVASERFDFCVVGAGPAGLQVALTMQQLGMEYVVLERNAGPGSFFETYPRHRQLISINKRYTANGNDDFNLRHDWNSLLFDDEQVEGSVVFPLKRVLFRDFSPKFFPHADTMPQYLRKVVQENALNVRYQTGVLRTRRKVESGTPGDFFLDLAGNSNVQCGALILATGKAEPRRIGMPGEEEHVTGYETVSTDPMFFTNKTILILGAGNAALETLQAVEDEAAFTHLLCRRPPQYAHQTHYPGHARAVNLGFVDKYQLKSLDALLAAFGFQGRRFVREETPDGPKIFLRPNEQGGNVVGSSLSKENDPLRIGYDVVVRCAGFRWDPSPFIAGGAPLVQSAGDTQVRDVTVASDPSQTYAEVGSNFESTSEPDVFVAGALGHFRDHKRSSGAFIHGFRYLARSLVWQLRERYLGVPYPHQIVGPSRGRWRTQRAAAVDALLKVFVKRMQTTSSLYQMFGQLADVIVLRPGGEDRMSDDKSDLVYLQDVPLDLISSVNPFQTGLGIATLREAALFVTVSLEFGPMFQGVGVLWHQGQAEQPSRKLEKMLWTPDTDPDLRVGTSGYDKAAAEERARILRRKKDELEMAPPDYNQLQPLEPFQFQVVTSDGDEEMQENLPRPKPSKGKFGNQFLHPVLRTWRRQAAGHPARMLYSERLREDVHNEWWLQETHIEPLREFFSGALDEMSRSVRGK